MDSDNERSDQNMDSDNEGTDQHQQASFLSSFLFGNIDRSGQLEDDLFDEETKMHLGELSKVTNLGSDLSQITEEENSEIPEIQQIAGDEIAEMLSKLAPLTSDDSEDYDGDDEENEVESVEGLPLNALNLAVKLDSVVKRPLAGAMCVSSKYDNADLEKLFPGFLHNQPLRCNRLFQNTRVNCSNFWRGVKKRKRSTLPAIPERKSRTGLDLTLQPDPTPDECQPDEMDKFVEMLDEDRKTKIAERLEISVDDAVKVNGWRHGPAKFWYDMLDVPDSGDGFDYGFKLKDVEDEENDEYVDEIPEDCYQMVNQLSWEDDVVWEAADIKEKVMAKLNSKDNNTGWPLKPNNSNRTLLGFSLHAKTTQTPTNSTTKPPNDTWYSIFPVENEDLVYGNWENDVIWDAESMDRIPTPKDFTLDPNDENVVLGPLNDTDPNARPISPERPSKEKKNAARKSKIFPETATEEPESDPEPTVAKSIYNISNDEDYNSKMTNVDALHMMGMKGIQHSTPAIELRAPFFPTHLGMAKLRSFHRQPVKKYSHGDVTLPVFHKVYPLRKMIRKKAKAREQERQACGGGEMFFMRTTEDLTGCDGELILAEYCEQHPPLVMQVGMATKIKNYYKRKPGKEQSVPEYRYGETAFAHTAPFLGSLAPGQSLQAFENNLFRSPIYEQPMSDFDFLIVRTRQRYFIRTVDSSFTVGQLCPLHEVPGPNSKRAVEFVRNFLQVYIYRLFWKSEDVPRRIKMEDIRKAFPAHSESSIRKRLKACAEFKRTGMDSNWWVLRPNFRLPTEDEIREMVSPEQCCGYYSMVAAQQRLKDAGYGAKTLFSLDNNDDDEVELQVKMDDEVNAAPWNTTRAFIDAMNNKCTMQLTGVCDPTGCGEGFAYVRVAHKPTKEEVDAKRAAKKIVTGTDADLRKLSLNNAKCLLKKYGIGDEQIRTLSRWEIIDAVRTLSIQQAKDGGVALSKFVRKNRSSFVEQQEKYKEECQRLFDLQNRILGSNETLPSEISCSSDDDMEVEAMAKNIDDLIAERTTTAQLSYELEEIERLELHKMLMEDPKDPTSKPLPKKTNKSAAAVPQSNRTLKIYRTFRSPDGQEYVRNETIRTPSVIDTYLRVKTATDPAVLQHFLAPNEQQKEEMRKEIRRIQEQLRRLRRNEARDRLCPAPPSTKRTRKEKPELKLRCGACGGVGHMRTNRSCPAYDGSSQSLIPPASVAVTEEVEEEAGDLVKVEGTKLVVSKQLVMRADELRRKSLVLKFPKRPVVKARRQAAPVDCDYLKRPRKSANRRRTDPVNDLSTIFVGILNEMRDLPNTQPFLAPVSARMVTDYYNIVSRPMDLQTMRDNLRRTTYRSREEFLFDVNQMVENSTLYNGALSPLTVIARSMLDLCLRRFADHEANLMRIEKTINPLLDDDDQVGLSFILERLVRETLKMVADSRPFHHPVEKKRVKDYYDIVRHPMDLETITRNIKAHKYRNRVEFLNDVDLMHRCSVEYNGKGHAITIKAKEIYDVAKTAVYVQFDEQLRAFEGGIRRTLDDGENESIVTGTNDDESQSRQETDDESSIDVVGDDEASVDIVCDDVASSIDIGAFIDVGVVDDAFIDVGGEENSEVHFPSHDDEINVLIEDLQITPDNSSASDDGSNIDVDENYEPSAFLFGDGGTGLQQRATEVADASVGNIVDDLLMSESEDDEL